MDLNIAAAWLALGKLRSEDAIAAASSALDRGVYSESLGLLLYEQPVWSEVGPLFTTALSELIITGETSPYEGARRIWWEVANEPGADSSLLAFVGLASEWEDSPRYRPEYEADIMEEAQRLVSGKADD